MYYENKAGYYLNEAVSYGYEAGYLWIQGYVL